MALNRLGSEKDPLLEFTWGEGLGDAEMRVSFCVDFEICVQRLLRTLPVCCKPLDMAESGLAGLEEFSVVLFGLAGRGGCFAGSGTPSWSAFEFGGFVESAGCSNPLRGGAMERED